MSVRLHCSYFTLQVCFSSSHLLVCSYVGCYVKELVMVARLPKNEGPTSPMPSSTLYPVLLLTVLFRIFSTPRRVVE